MKRWLPLVLLVFLSGCQLLFFLPEQAYEGTHYTQTLTSTDLDRGQRVAACLQDWARHNGYPAADYSDVDFNRMVIVGVGDPGVVNNPLNPTDWVGGRESGDTIFIPLKSPAWVAIELHEMVHIVQQSHNELIGSDGDIHWAPPWDHCSIRRYIWT